MYEQVGDWSLSSPLTKYSVKEYWLRAALCAMAMGVSRLQSWQSAFASRRADVAGHAQDLVTCQRLLASFAQKDVTFPSTRESKFAQHVMDACEQGDVEAFQEAVFNYDQVTKLDNWKTGVLLRIKKGLESEVEGLT